MPPRTSTCRRPKSASARYRGLTLLELVTALALACLLLAGVTGILRLLKLQHDELAQQQGPQAAQRRLVEVLERDLANSRQIWISKDRRTLRLRGYVGRAGVLHQSAEIRYQVVTFADNSWFLLRVEVNLPDLGSRPRQVNVLAWNVNAISIRRMDMANRSPTPGFEAESLQHGRGMLEETWTSVPDQALVGFWSADNQLLFASAIIVR